MLTLRGHREAPADAVDRRDLQVPRRRHRRLPDVPRPGEARRHGRAQDGRDVRRRDRDAEASTGTATTSSSSTSSGPTRPARTATSRRRSRALEEVDTYIEELHALQADVFMVAGDHSTPAVVAGHSWHPVPFLLPRAGTSARPTSTEGFNEKACARGVLGTFPAKEVLSLAMAHAGPPDEVRSLTMSRDADHRRQLEDEHPARRCARARARRSASAATRSPASRRSSARRSRTCTMCATTLAGSTIARRRAERLLGGEGRVHRRGQRHAGRRGRRVRDHRPQRAPPVLRRDRRDREPRASKAALAHGLKPIMCVGETLAAARGRRDRPTCSCADARRPRRHRCRRRLHRRVRARLGDRHRTRGRRRDGAGGDRPDPHDAARARRRRRRRRCASSTAAP